MKKTLFASAAVLALGFSTPVLAQSETTHDPANHSAHMAQGANDTSGAEVVQATPTETGQSAFAAIAEIVLILQADPNTDWNAVNIDALRAHLADMNAVTLLSDVVTSHVHGGAVFEVTSSDAKTTDSIRRMLLAHGKTMSGVDGMDMGSVEVEGGARMTVTGPNPTMIRGLGFFGVMTLGMHHQAHHIAVASGKNPHN